VYDSFTLISTAVITVRRRPDGANRRLRRLHSQASRHLWRLSCLRHTNANSISTVHTFKNDMRIQLFLSLQFLQRDAMHKRGLWHHAASVSPSVRLSVTFVDRVKTKKHIFEIFSPSGSHTILVFPYQTGWRYSDGNPLTGASNAGGV